MAEPIQVVRVKRVMHRALLGTTLTFFDDNDQRWAITGDVIELTELDFTFDGPPGPDPPRFIETHDAHTGSGVGWGKWIDNGDGTWSLIGLAAEVRRDADA